MANETHTLRIGIDASAAKRGSQAYVAAVGKIAQATKDFDKLQAQMGKSMSKGGSFSAVARDLARLNSLRINPSLAKGIQQFSTAMANFKSPSAASVKNMRTFMRELGNVKINSALGKNLGAISSALSNFKGPSRAGTANTQALIRILSGARLNASYASSLAALSNTLNGFRGPNTQMVRNIEAFARALSNIRVPRGMGSLSSSLTALNSRMGSTSGAAIRLGGSVNGIPWGRASAGAIQLTGNLRGLENAMSLSYQMGSQLRALFGALTISGFTSSVIEATATSDRLRYLLGAVSDSVGEVENQMAFAQDTANKYGLSLLDVQKQFGRFAAAGRSTGLSVEQTQYTFEALSAQMRLFGLDSQQQSRAILAITQMFQKGAVQAEEFKTQLGEQLPVFEAMRQAMAKVTGDENVDIMKMMEQGMIGSDSILLMLREMETMFGKGIPDALKNPLVGMQNLQNAWTEFLKLVGGAGVMDALGEVSWRLADIIRTDEFREMATAIAEGLGNAIRKAGDAAAWLLTNIDTVGKVIAAVLGMRAVTVAMQLGGAFASIGQMAGNAIGAVGGLGKAILTFGRGASILGAIPVALGAITGAFGLAAVAAGAALVFMWDNTVKLGETTTTVGAMARVAFEDFGNWAQWAGQQVMTMFQQGAEIASQWFASLNQSITGGKASWEDWAKTILGLIHLVGSTMIDVFKVAWNVLIGGALHAGKLVGGVITGLVASFAAIGDAATMNFSEAGRKLSVGAAAMGTALSDTGEWAKTVGGDVANLFTNAKANTDAYVAGLDAVTTEWNTNRQAVIDYFDEVAKRSTDPKYNPKPYERTADTTYTPPNLPDMDSLTPLNKEYDAAGGKLSALAKRAKDAEEAMANFKAEQQALQAALSAGKITLDQYNQALDYHKGKLEESVDPYSAMIRSMQEENNLLRLNGQEQRVASDFMQRKNQLLEAGIVLTDEQTASLKAMVAEQDKLKNPGPLQSWVNNMETAADAIESAGVRAMESLSDNIADMVVEGKADWASLAKQILKDLIKIGLNEMWKPMFGGSQPQQAVNAPMSGALGQSALQNMNTPGGNQAIMAAAVAQGIQMAGGGMGVGGFGTLGNDVGGGGGGLSALQAFAGSGKSNPRVNSLLGASAGIPGAGNAPQFDDFVTALPQSTAAASNLATAATGLGGAATQLTGAANMVQSGYESFNNGIKTLAGGLGGNAPLPVSVETISTIPTAGRGIPSMAGAGFGVPNMGSAPTFPQMTQTLAGGGNRPGGWRSIEQLLAPGKSSSHATGLDPEFAKRIESMFNAPDAPEGLEIFSGYRSVEHQQQLWDAALKKYGSPAAARKWVAPPGASSHNSGRAIDFGQNGSTFSGMDPAAQQWVHQNAAKYGMKLPLSNEGWHMEMQETRGGAPFTGQLPGYSQASMTPGMPGSMPGVDMMTTQGIGGMQPGMMQPSMAGMMGGGGSFSSLPGGMQAGTMGGFGGGMGMGQGMQGLGDQVKAELTPAFQQVATQIPQQFDPAMGQVAQALPQKLTENTEGLSEQLTSAMQPGHIQAAQDNAQKYQEANTQAANDFAMKMQQATSQAGGGMGGMGGGGGGGLGGMLGGLGGILGGFFSNGGIVGKSGGSTKSVGAGASAWAGARSMKFGGIVGDPDAEPIIAHKGEMVVPASEVEAMRRTGKDTSLFDNAAVARSRKTAGVQAGTEEASDGASVNGFQHAAALRPVINYNISTPDANSFRASQGQIQAKAGAAAYRDAVRNH